jgi:hypothetical protein
MIKSQAGLMSLRWKARNMFLTLIFESYENPLESFGEDEHVSYPSI